MMQSSAVELNSRPILYFGNDWYAENRTSSHHVARCLSHWHKVHYVECPGMRAPVASRRDRKRVVQKLWRWMCGSTEVSPTLRVHTLLQIPAHRYRLVRWVNRLLTLWTVRWLMWRHGIERPIAWFVIPHVASLVGQLGEAVSVYFCTDDHASMPGVNAEKIRQMDALLTQKSDIVFAVSENLRKAKASVNARTYYTPHGVQVEHFARAQAPETTTPTDIAHLPHPIIGFFGLIEGRFDLELVAYAAEQRPQWTFLMIGHVGVPQNTLPNLDNLHFIGKRPYDQLPNYGRQFSAAIIPYMLSQQARYGNPLKLREYLAMGKPVVSVGAPEADHFKDLVEVASSYEQFVECLDKVIARGDSPELAKRRMQCVADSSWESRVSSLLDHLRGYLSAKTDEDSPGPADEHTSVGGRAAVRTSREA